VGGGPPAVLGGSGLNKSSAKRGAGRWRMGLKTGLRWWIYDHLARVQWIRRLHEVLLPFARALSVLAGAITVGVLSWIAQPSAVWVVRGLLAFATAVAAFFAVWDFGIRWTDSQVGAFKRKVDFTQLLCTPLPSTEARHATAEEVSLAAKLEHEAFSIYGSTTEDIRAQRLGKWFADCSKSIYFMLRDSKIIGYSVIIPVSKLDAERYRAGLMKEFGFVPDTSSNPPMAFYAQSLFLEREWQSHSECLGLAQRVFLQHLASFFPAGASTSFCILADSETWDGRRFLYNLGFRRGEAKGADGRPIYELDLRQPDKLNDDGKVFLDVFPKIVAANHNRTQSA
jgi:hypothetical protein